MSELRADDPRHLGAYRLSGRLGQGGQGVVYVGHTGDGAKVAIKLLHASLSADPVVRRRFLSEVEALRRVAPFCTAQLLDADLEGDRPYLVSEYVDGVSLGEHVLTAGPRTGGSLHRLAIGTATALGAIHRAGVVHRDFKPGNVLLSLDGPRVIDFGVSRLADGTATTGMIPMGTPAYLAPERIEGVPAGPAADLYAWGLTVAYTATGRHAFAGGTHQEVLARILYGRPDLGALSGRLREIVDACLAPDPADRPDAEEVLRLLLGQDLTGDVLTSGAMAAVDAGARSDGAAPGDGKTVAWRSPDSTGPQTTGEPGRGRGGRSRRPSGRSALAALVDPTAPLSTAGTTVASEGAPEPRAGSRGSAALEELPARSGRGGSAEGFPAVGGGGGTPGEAAGSRGKGGAARARRRLWWVAGVVAVLVSAGAGVAYWTGMTGGTAVEGLWIGSARHPTADRVFPVEIRLGGERESRMRWGADLHCSGKLSPTARGLVFALGDVTGKECHPGTLHLLPTADANQMGMSVIRQGQHDVTYSGRVSRTS